MTVDNLATFLLAYMTVVSIAAGILFLRGGLRWLPVLLAAMAALAMVTKIGVRVVPGTHLLQHIFDQIVAREPRYLIASSLGGAAGLAWLAVSWGRAEPLKPSSRLAAWLVPLTLLTSIGGVSLTGGALLLEGTGYLGSRGNLSRAHDSKFRLETITSFITDPIRVAIDPRGRIFVSLNNTSQGFSDGSIVEITIDPHSGKAMERVVAQSALLFRPYGLTVHDGDLYVSHSGVLGRADRGRITFEDSGSVTRLSDPDSDGIFDYYDDVLRGLPGARDSLSQHSNNGLEFGPDGALYLAVGISSNNSPGGHMWEGTILRSDLISGVVEVFARGLRNPFDLTFGPDGALFVVDQDTDGGIGDKFLHVRKGDHFGHPFDRPELPSITTGFARPIAMSDKYEGFTAIAYTGDNPNLPLEYRRGFLIADWTADRVVYLALEHDGNGYSVARKTTFADVQDPTDLAISPEGDVYVLSYFGRRLYRIRIIKN